MRSAWSPRSRDSPPRHTTAHASSTGRGAVAPRAVGGGAGRREGGARGGGGAASRGAGGRGLAGEGLTGTQGGGGLFFFFQAEDGIRDYKVTGVQTCALPI